MILIRRVATLAALSLATAGLGAVAAQPAIAADDATLQWGLSTYLNEHLTQQSFTDGATESADGVVTFTGGTTAGDTTTYRGTASYSFSGLYSFAFSDLAVTLDDQGDGTIAADVAWTAPGASGEIPGAVLTTFSTDDDFSDGSLTATPDWAGVAPADAYGSGKPVGGASWAVAFVSALPSSVNPTFYASGSGNDPKKPPAPFTATAGEAGPAVATTASYAGGAVTFEVAGTGFAPVYNPPREDGVYAALAPAGTFPETDDFEDQEKVAVAAYITNAQIVEGSFTTLLAPEAKYLNPSKRYSIYTWQAHAHTNSASDTETPVKIDWSKVGQASKLKVTQQAGKLVVTNGKAVGKVSVKLTQGKTSKTAKATMKKGKATVKLPKLTSGTWKAKVTFTPTVATYRAATKTVNVKK